MVKVDSSLKTLVESGFTCEFNNTHIDAIEMDKSLETVSDAIGVTYNQESHKHSSRGQLNQPFFLLP